MKTATADVMRGLARLREINHYPVFRVNRRSRRAHAEFIRITARAWGGNYVFRSYLRELATFSAHTALVSFKSAGPFT